MHTTSVRLLVAACVLLLVGSLPASAQCEALQLRLWQPGGAETWYDAGDTVSVPAGQEGHLYLHVRARGQNRYSTAAEIGYPGDFGLDGRAQDVLQHVRMTAQSHEDRSMGRIRFTAQKPGTTALGYRLLSVERPGSLDQIAAGCRTGKVSIRVEGQNTAPPASGGDSAGSAAEEVVDLLYRALLQRDRGADEVPDAVRQVERGGRDAIFDLAAVLTGSPEFRNEAPRRVNGGVEGLLDAIYRDLYGSRQPSSGDYREDLRNLEECLESRRGADVACDAFGRDVVGSRLFYDAHRDLVDDLERGDGLRVRRRG